MEGEGGSGPRGRAAPCSGVGQSLVWDLLCPQLPDPCSPSLVPKTKLLTQYVLSLAKYDQNYDIRDRARFTRQLIVPSEQGGALSRHAKKLFLAPKPAPVLESSFKGGS